jgi:MFS family permease
LFISRPITGKLLDVKGDNIVIYPALLMFSLSLFLLSQARNSFVLLIAGALVALGYGTMLSCGQAIAIKVTAKHRVGLATSTFFICFDIGMGIGPFLTGMIVPIVHFRGMYVILAIMIFLSIILYYFIHGKNVNPGMNHSVIQKN